jgi:hypothetical protein
MPLTQLAIAVVTTSPQSSPVATACTFSCSPGGRELWRFRDSFAGRENMLSFVSGDIGCRSAIATR